MIPYKDLDAPPASFAATSIALLTAAAFLWQLSQAGTPLLAGIHEPASQTLFALYGFTPQSPSWPAVATYPLLHVSALHLAGNLLFLQLFGPALESRTRPLQFIALYALSAATAALIYMAAFPGSPNPLVGASGAVSGVTAAYAITCPRHRIALLTPSLQTTSVPSLVLIALWAAWQLLQPLALNQPPDALVAHAAGAAAGASLALAAERAKTLVP